MAENIKPAHIKPEYIKPQEKREERLVRILSKDIEGKMKVYAGLTKIKGVSWTFSNAVCKVLKLDKNKTGPGFASDTVTFLFSQIACCPQ